MLKAFACALFAAVAVGMEEMQAPRMVMRIKLPIGEGLGEMIGLPEQEPMHLIQLPDMGPMISKMFSSSSSILDDFGHESLFDEIFPESHRKADMFPSFRRIDNDGGGAGMGGMGGMGGFLSNMISGMMSGAMKRGGFRRPHVIDLSQPIAEDEQAEEKKGHCCCKDLHAHCGSIKHDGTIQGVFAVTKCLALREKEHHDVEPFCAAKVAQTVAGACLDDITTYCPSLTPGQSQIHTCLYKQRDALSATCKKYMHIAAKSLPALATTTSTPAPSTAVVVARRAEAAKAAKAKAAASRAAAKAHPFRKAAPTKLTGNSQQRATGAPTITLEMQRSTKNKNKNAANNLAAAAPATTAKEAAQAAPSVSKTLYVALGCVGAALVAGVAALIVSRSRRSSGADQSAYSAMLI